jgi:hypothetical protein
MNVQVVASRFVPIARVGHREKKYYVRKQIFSLFQFHHGRTRLESIDSLLDFSSPLALPSLSPYKSHV